MNEMLLAELCADLGLSLSEAQMQSFSRYYEELLVWNQKFNLTAIEDEQGVIIKHFYDSILGSRVSGWTGKGKLLDLGSGAGFPGVPLKIVFPELQATLVDSLQKRISFLEHLIHTLGLKDIKAVHSRAEDFGRIKAERENYDFVVSRAVAKLPILSEYCLPLVKKGGIFIAYKGPEGKEEIEKAEKAMEILGGQLHEALELQLPKIEGERLLFAIKKYKNTPSEYPRKAGNIKKKPL